MARLTLPTILWPIVTLAISGAAACKKTNTPQVYDMDAIPSHLSAPVKDAQQAMATLKGELGKRLKGALAKDGPIAAIKLCRDQAQPITKALNKLSASAKRKIVVGRTSHRLRNPNNAPPIWARPFVSRAAQNPKQAKAVVIDLGTRIGVLKPIPTGQLCTTCHGSRDQLHPELAKVLASAYPDDQAVGFSAGQLRGFFWAEVTKAAE